MVWSWLNPEFPNLFTAPNLADSGGGLKGRGKNNYRNYSEPTGNGNIVGCGE